MAAIRTYGIPGIIESQEIFPYNNGLGKLKVRFRGGIVDPKYDIPATYSTDNEFEQLVIESSVQFGTKVYRYGANGQIISSTPIVAETPTVRSSGKKTQNIASSIDADTTTEYPNVETLGDATEVLMELGVDASDLSGKAAVLAAMVQKKVSFPNLKLK